MGLPCLSEIVVVGIRRWVCRHWLLLASGSVGVIWWLSR